MEASRRCPQSPGRPGHSKGMRFRALLAVARQRRIQGKAAGWRPITKALQGQIPTGLVQEALSRFKARNRRRHRRHLADAARSMTVRAKNVIWTQDGTHLGRDGSAFVIAQVVKDRGPYSTLALSVGPPAKSRDVLMLLKCTKAEEGTHPLVWQTDNDSIYLEESVQDYLRKERVVHLLSRVRRPQDNGAAEIGIRELKTEAGLGKGVRLKGTYEAALRLGKSAVKLNHDRLRGSKGYLPSDALADRMPSWYDFVTRERFYDETCNAMEEAVQGKKGSLARKAQREAIFSRLEKYGLITRTRGGKPQKVCERERIN